MNRILSHTIAITVLPFIAAIAVAATPVKVEQVQAGLEVAIAPEKS